MTWRCRWASRRLVLVSPQHQQCRRGARPEDQSERTRVVRRTWTRHSSPLISTERAVSYLGKAKDSHSCTIAAVEGILPTEVKSTMFIPTPPILTTPVLIHSSALATQPMDPVHHGPYERHARMRPMSNTFPPTNIHPLSVSHESTLSSKPASLTSS